MENFDADQSREKMAQKKGTIPLLRLQYCEFDKFGRHCMSEGIKANNGKMRCLIVPKKEAFKEAAEFEARVAKRLAFMAVNRNEESPCNKREPCDPVGCYSCWIKTARLEVEEEMEK